MAVTADHLMVIGRGRVLADAPIDAVLTGGTEEHVLVRTDDADALTTALGQCLSRPRRSNRRNPMRFGQLLDNSSAHLFTEGIVEMSFEPPPVMFAIQALLLSFNPRVRGVVEVEPRIARSNFSTLSTRA